MAAYDDLKNALTRTPVKLLVLTLDFCGRSFGVAPCTATGEPCYNTWHTCKDQANYLLGTKDYRFTSWDAPLPFKTVERPYLKSITTLPTEIKDKLTVNSRVKPTLLDEPDTDVGIDPYVSQRSSIQGTFWKKLLARNPNYKGRDAAVYDGFIGLLEPEFKQIFKGKIDNISVGRGEVTIEIVDLLKSLASINVPQKMDIKLVADITDAATEMTLSDVTGLDDPAGYVRIGDEIIYYTGVNAPTNQLTGCTRGYFSTTAANHSANGKVQPVRYYAPSNPFDILKEMLLTDAGFAVDDVDTTSFDYWRDWPGGEIEFSAIVSEPTKLESLYFEILDLLDCRSWVGEDLQVTIRRNIPNEPGRSYHYLSDEANIVHNSASVDLNAKSRLSRVALYWDKSAIGKDKDDSSYSRMDVGIDAEAESANDYNESIEDTIYCRWLRSGYLQEELLIQFVTNFLARRIFMRRDPQPILTFGVELKDGDVKTGDMARISTDEILDIDGMPLDRTIFQINKRDPRGGKVGLKARQLSPDRFGFIAPNTAPDWIDATEADKEYGFITDNDGLMPDGASGYHIW